MHPEKSEAGSCRKCGTVVAALVSSALTPLGIDSIAAAEEKANTSARDVNAPGGRKASEPNDTASPEGTSKAAQAACSGNAGDEQSGVKR